MSDLVAFLTARYDEVEFVAKGAARTDGGLGGAWTKYFPGTSGDFDARVDDHIALHDPARVLRGVEAKRKILALHEGQPSIHGTGKVLCRYCGVDDGWYDVKWPCETVRALASEFSDRPDYPSALE